MNAANNEMVLQTNQYTVSSLNNHQPSSK